MKNKITKFWTVYLLPQSPSYCFLKLVLMFCQIGMSLKINPCCTVNAVTALFSGLGTRLPSKNCSGQLQNMKEKQEWKQMQDCGEPELVL